MRRTLVIAAALLAVFAIVLIIRLPASWASALLPSGVDCRSPSGTLWRGACGELVAQQVVVGAVGWQVHPAALLRGTLDAHVSLARGAASAAADVLARSGGPLVARNLKAVVPLESASLPQLPRDMRGTVRLDLSLLQMNGRVVERIVGSIEARDLARRSAGGYALGSYAATFAPGAAGAEPVGQLRDLGGPVDFSGTVRLTREPGYVLEGAIAARPGADPQLVEQFRYLGNPDAAGRRPFSLAGTY